MHHPDANRAAGMREYRLNSVVIPRRSHLAQSYDAQIAHF